MAEQVDERDETDAIRDVKGELDERRIARGLALAVPLVTLTVAMVAGVTLGAPMVILVLAAGMLIGVISLFWASLRVLSGDAPLSPELEALDATAHAVDALANRKRMLLRALKDLDNERALGKLDDDDHEQITRTYRMELKDVMRRIDASLEPHRPKAEEAAKAHLARVGLIEKGYRGTQPAGADDESGPSLGTDADAGLPAGRVACEKCGAANDVDAAFCKKCGKGIAEAKVDVEANVTATAAAELPTEDER